MIWPQNMRLGILAIYPAKNAIVLNNLRKISSNLEQQSPCHIIRALIFLDYLQGGKLEFNLLYTILLLKKKERNGLAKAADLTNYAKETQTARDKDLGLIIFAHTIGNSKRYR